ncbi:MAG: hypothetical protein ACOCUH_03250 [Bacteriovoracia bacterium]
MKTYRKIEALIIISAVSFGESFVWKNELKTWVNTFFFEESVNKGINALKPKNSKTYLDIPSNTTARVRFFALMNKCLKNAIKEIILSF